jgi:hypothetical protein
MRKLWLALLSIVIVICIGFILYSRTYTITDSKIQLTDNILRFFNRPTIIANNIDIKQEVNLDNKKYVIFIVNNRLGDAELTKGLNNKYKIESTGDSSSYFRDEIKKTNKGKYLILQGKNLDNKIAYCKVMLDNKEYKIIISQQEYFMVYCEVPIETQSQFPDANDIKLYSSNDADITNDMFNALLK